MLSQSPNRVLEDEYAHLAAQHYIQLGAVYNKADVQEVVESN